CICAFTNDRLCVISFIIFFFQAEDGIRDRNVTGVQTCALPISLARSKIKLFLDYNLGKPSAGLLERACWLADGRGAPRVRAGREIGRASCRGKRGERGGERVREEKRRRRERGRWETTWTKVRSV